MINPQLTPKGLALRGVPFSCCFYSSRPLSAVLTRRRFQFLHVLINSLDLLLRLTVVSQKNYTLSTRFKFSVLETRSPSLPSANQVCSISSFMPMRDGVEISKPHSFHCDHARSAILIFDEPVEWNGWNFVTSRASSTDHDPVRFALYAAALDGDDSWQLAGSSTYANFGGYVSLWHGPFDTSRERGRKHVFDLLRPSYGMAMAVVWASCSIMAALSRSPVSHRCLSLAFSPRLDLLIPTGSSESPRP
jgi:hypothetical protein